MNKTEKAKKLGLLGLALCGLCCALPVIGTAVGIASLSAVAVYLEKIGIAIIGLTAFFMWYAWYSKRKATKAVKPCSCNTSCRCKTGTGA